MQTLARGRAFFFAVACLCAALVACGHARALAEGQERASEAEAVEVDDKARALAERLLDRKRKNVPSRSEMLEATEGKVDLAKVASRLERRLPADVAGLVSMGVKHKDGAGQEPTFDETSMQKARKVLNDLIEKAWKEMDDKLIECKEFEDKNRGTFEQVMTDIARLAEQIADAERIKAEAIEQIQMTDREITSIAGKLKMEYSAYMRVYLENSREMTIRKNDMAVFQFLVTLTECKGNFIQLAGGRHNHNHRGPRLCEDEHGLRLDFDDMKSQKEVDQRMTPTTRRELRVALQRIKALEEAGSPSFLQEDDEEEREAATTTATTTTPAAPTPPVPKVEVKTVPGSGNWVKCTQKPPDCGLLNDNMSLLWGKFKDLVDELQMEMDKNAYAWKMLQIDLNQQMEVLRNAKARFILQLNEAVANMNADREEMAEKEDERGTLEHEYIVYMKACKKRIEWIMFQDICAFIGLRASVLKTSTTCPPKNIIDCDWSVWVPSECSVPCDDSCPDPSNPYACGGWQTLIRAFIVQPNDCGYKCPEPKRRRKCNQIKCPVDCVMSRFSSWSKCSKECEGGVQGRTRSILTQPLNGGMSCNTAQESRACNTGSCDRNCRLKKWSKWSPCSVACGGGFQERWRRVTVPIRGNGRCPKPSSRIRYDIKKCNTFDCNGDEICIAKQDLVMAIDASGSLRAAGFKIVKDFATKLVEKYKGEYFGFEDMRIGVVQFGNGKIQADGTVSNAILKLELTSTMADVKTAVAGLEYKKGFTNMAQAFDMAEKMFLLGGRKEAQSAVMTITDGKPSFLFQTYQKVMELKDKHVKLFFAPITSFKGDEMKLMKKWASSPWPTHLVHIPGLLPLQADEKLFAQRILVKFCPEAMSPSAMMTQEKEQGYLLVRERGYCGHAGWHLSSKVSDAAECAALTAEAKKTDGSPVQAFTLGVRYAKGQCWAETLEVDKAKFDAILADRAAPPCSASEGWVNNALYDLYVLEPIGSI